MSWDGKKKQNELKAITKKLGIETNMELARLLKVHHNTVKAYVDGKYPHHVIMALRGELLAKRIEDSVENAEFALFKYRTGE